MDELTQVNRVSFDVEFGTIKFSKEPSGTYAVIGVDVAIKDQASPLDRETQITTEIKFSVQPETDPMLAIVETGRRLLIARLRGAADIIEAKSSETLLFGSPD